MAGPIFFLRRLLGKEPPQRHQIEGNIIGTTALEGQLQFDPDNTYDIGSSGGADRPRDVFAGRNLESGGALFLGTFIEFAEQAGVPDTPDANRGRLYIIDNGAGKSSLRIVWADGAVSTIVTQA